MSDSPPKPTFEERYGPWICAGCGWAHKLGDPCPGEPLCPDSPDGQHHSAPIGSEEELTQAGDCWYCGEKATKFDEVVRNA